MHHPNLSETKGDYDGEIEDGGIPAGQSAGLIHSVEPAEEIVRRIVEEARSVLRDRLALA